MADKSTIREILEGDLNPYENRLHRRLTDELVEGFISWPGFSQRLFSRGEKASDDQATAITRQLFFFVKERIAGDLNEIAAIRKRHAEFIKRYTRASIPEEKQRHVLDFASELGATPGQIRNDGKAFGRWFGQDAMQDRFERRQNWLERRLTFCLGRLAVLCEAVLESEPQVAVKRNLWESLDLEEALGAFFVFDGDSRVCVAAFRCLARALRSLPAKIRERSVHENTVQYIYRSAMYSRQDLWLQCEALTLLENLSPQSLKKVLEHRLGTPAPGDDLFVRRRAVQILLRNLERMPELGELLRSAPIDPSPFVRQGMAEALPAAPQDVALRYLTVLSTDEVPQVRAAALETGQKLLSHRNLAPSVLDVWKRLLQSEHDPFVLRVAIEVAARSACFLLSSGSPFAHPWCAETVAALEELHVEAQSAAVRRWAAQARERIWSEYEPRARSVKILLSDWLAGLAAGEQRTLPASLLVPYPDDLMGRVAAVLCQEDFGFDVERLPSGVRFTRGQVFGFRFWRLLHELRNSATDKRQAFPHTVGRIFRGTVRVPSAVLAELAETKVPGEPLVLPEEAGWRPYLPLLDDVLSSSTLLKPRAVRVYTSEGVTEFSPPGSLWRRLRASMAITFGFRRYAELRNATERTRGQPASYLEALTALGFTFYLCPHQTEMGKPASLDPTLEKCFPKYLSGALPLGGLGFVDNIWAAAREYFVSFYENSLVDLAIFVAVTTGLFVGRHLYLNAALRKSRNRFPLVVGGWGTRGKSGTERLKAALFNALGFGIVSKTTGCEAMFLYAHPFGKLRELFLFRPYDKATIWEQYNLVQLADRLGCEVFLWECMGLTPAYVEILQRGWMRDDLSTITNTYPDHEDLQGPAGFNIPEVMTNFVPEKSRLVTSEDQMLPILKEAARKLETSLQTVTWRDAGMLTPDVLERFPYDEHPNNIALVLALADDLGVDRDFALKEMADRVVPDLGVLKTYPVAALRGRRLQFVNGMSANERHGCLGNWTRLGFDRQDPVAEPDVWITTVVNNRADRVPRSKVFAKILVEDLSCDRHFLIGTNLNGFLGFLHQAWKEHAAKLCLWSPDSETPALRVLIETAQRFRVPTAREHVAARLRAMLANLKLPEELQQKLDAFLEDPTILKAQLIDAGFQERADAIVHHVEEGMRHLREYEDLAHKVTQVSPDQRATVETEFRNRLWTWFRNKVVVVQDPHTSGEQLVERICEETPPGSINRVMGLQNIKGTGLDFVYRWQAWDACHEACVKVRSKDLAEIQEGLKALSSFQEYGLLSEEFVRETIHTAKARPAAQRESIQAELAVVQSNLDLAMHRIRERMRGGTNTKSKFGVAVTAVEGLLDAGDAVKRRRTANRIYKDLAAGRISYERAAYELQGLNKRQKGGWLVEKLRSAQSLLGRRATVFYSRTRRRG